MSAVNFQRSFDRPALVNTVLGKVFGVSRSGFLRAGQSMSELDRSEWSRVLGAFQRSATVVIGSPGGTALPRGAMNALHAETDDPVTEALLQEVRSVRVSLSPALARLRAHGCFKDDCPANVLALADMIGVSLTSLERAIADEAPVDDLREEIMVVGDLIDELDGKIDGETQDAERVRIGLDSASQRLDALSTWIGSDWLAAPVAASLQTVEQCSRCIEEGISDVREVTRELGLSDCDLERALGEGTQVSLASMLLGLGRSWVRITQLSGLEGHGVLAQIRRAAKDAACRIKTRLDALDDETMAGEYGLSSEDAERLHRVLERLKGQAGHCADELTRHCQRRPGGRALEEAIAQDAAPLPREADNGRPLKGAAVKDRAKRLRHAPPQVAKRPEGLNPVNPKRPALSSRQPTSVAGSAPDSAPPSADAAPMQELDRS